MCTLSFLVFPWLPLAHNSIQRITRVLAMHSPRFGYLACHTQNAEWSL